MWNTQGQAIEKSKHIGRSPQRPAGSSIHQKQKIEQP